MPSGAVMRMPRSGRAPASTALSTPRRSRTRLTSGERYSPQTLSRGNRARSRSVTAWPTPARRIAVAAPAGPAPTTTTSARGLAPGIHPDHPEGDGVVPGDLRHARGRGEVAELGSRVRPPDGERPVVEGDAIPGGRAREEPRARPGRPAPAEVRDHEAEPGGLRHPADELHHGGFGEVMEHERADREVDRAGPDRSGDRLPGHEADLGEGGRPPPGTGQDAGLDVEAEDPHGPAARARPPGEGGRDVGGA